MNDKWKMLMNQNTSDVYSSFCYPLSLRAAVEHQSSSGVALHKKRKTSGRAGCSSCAALRYCVFKYPFQSVAPVTRKLRALGSSALLGGLLPVLEKKFEEAAAAAASGQTVACVLMVRESSDDTTRACNASTASGCSPAVPLRYIRV
ncbi:hypothetical protein F2P81_013800 [Scophthalmus maximus]|uniref:Uncharacterized protein n=1 Tax=Scophthalmus maximus TaxID=52904 RepID=A0A6A4SRR8_SCOMX|nr:hypothetical protein F2P81_013800 [Scophthalmus maximus]